MGPSSRASRASKLRAVEKLVPEIDWIACDDCGAWHKLPVGVSAKAYASKRWTCAREPIALACRRTSPRLTAEPEPKIPTPKAAAAAPQARKSAPKKKSAPPQTPPSKKKTTKPHTPAPDTAPRKRPKVIVETVRWVQCDDCDAWRELPAGAAAPGDRWVCAMGPWACARAAPAPASPPASPRAARYADVSAPLRASLAATLGADDGAPAPAPGADADEPPEAESAEDLLLAWREQQRLRRAGLWSPAGRRAGAPAPAPRRAAPREAAGETPFAAALAAGAAAAGLAVENDRVVGYAAPTDALLAAAHGACALALPAGDAEDLAMVRLAQRYYEHWRPAKVRVVLLAESHVFTAPGDSAARPLSGEPLARLAAAGYDGPTGFVHLVHSLGYGEDDLLATPAGANKGTPQFWQLLAAASRDGVGDDCLTRGAFDDVLKKHGSTPLARLDAKLAVLRQLRDRGVWLLDASVLGWYIPQEAVYRRSAVSGEVHRCAKDRPPKRCKRPALLLSWELYMKHVVRSAADGGCLESVLPIGKEVFGALGEDRLRDAAGGAALLEPHPAPNAWVPGGYGPYFASLSRVCRPPPSES